MLDFDRLILVKRADAGQKTPRPQVPGEAGNFVGNDTIGFLNGLPINFQGNGYLREIAFDNKIAVLSPVRPEGQLTTLYRPEKPVFVGDLKLHFDGNRLLFSSVGIRRKGPCSGSPGAAKPSKRSWSISWSMPPGRSFSTPFRSVKSTFWPPADSTRSCLEVFTWSMRLTSWTEPP